MAAADERIDADLLIVGGTESGCAAAVQAARMGVKKIVLVNDIEWLGGQFSAESLAAIDENTDKTGIRHDPPIPRHGAFREVIDRIEADNVTKYGVARPGNTRVITTCRPADAARIFREWLQPFVASEQIILKSWYEPTDVLVTNECVTGVTFENVNDENEHLTVNARLTIDASDWGDVIRLSGAEFEFGPDLKSKYGEPLAPERRDGYPLTDMNPITYCIVIEETDGNSPIPEPFRYDPEHYRSHHWPKDPLWLYGTRRIIDHYHFDQIDHPDVLLLCFPAIDYPLDVHPQHVADALDTDQPGASQKNIVELSPAQRRLIFEDAKHYSLGFLHYLQTEIYDAMPDKTHSYRRFVLSDEFGTSDKLPFKPYARESLRMKAMYMMRQQDTAGVGGDSPNFASAMYHDSVAVWQFEYDFHPTKREFLRDGDTTGPWRCGFREGRTWGPPYSGRSTFPLRSLIPAKMNGLLAAQKNLGFSSIVSAAVRLHDASMGIGQASGACAAVAMKRNIAPREIPFDRSHLMALQLALVSQEEGIQPGTLWPYRDLQTDDECFAAANILAVQGCLPQRADEVSFRPDEPATAEWIDEVIALTARQILSKAEIVALPSGSQTRGEFALRWWDIVSRMKWKPYVRVAADDFDGDGIQDTDDSLPLDSENRVLPVSPPSPDTDGTPNVLTSQMVVFRQFNFAGRATPDVDGFVTDSGNPFDKTSAHGWNGNLSANHRQRGKAGLLPDTYIFTRSHHVWECELPNGHYLIDLSIGDAGHEQFGQNVTVEGIPVFRNTTTSAGRFAEKQIGVDVKDGRLTVEIGLPESSTNTCLNWIRIVSEAK